MAKKTEQTMVSRQRSENQRVGESVLVLGQHAMAAAPICPWLAHTGTVIRPSARPAPIIFIAASVLALSAESAV